MAPVSHKRQYSEAEQYKFAGNKYFNLKKFHDAARFYQKACSLDPSNSTFLTNLALANLKLNEIHPAMTNCRKAIEINPYSVKAHFYIGCCQLEIGHYDDAIVMLKRSIDLAKNQKLNFGDSLTSTLRIAKNKQMEAAEASYDTKMNDFQGYLKNLIIADEAKLKKEGGSSKDETLETKLAMLDEVFDCAMNNTVRKNEVPDYLCGQISFEILKDPMIAPSGITYDRKDIEEHLFKVGHFDPITRNPLVFEQLIPNIALKEVVDGYLKQNPKAEFF